MNFADMDQVTWSKVTQVSDDRLTWQTYLEIHFVIHSLYYTIHF